MTIIVTGAGGMLGQAVLRAAVRADVEVHGFTRAELDITDHSVSAATFRLPKPHTIINCAAIIRGRADTSAPQRWLINGVAPRALARRCDRLVQVSTDCVFDGHPSRAPFSEGDEVSPTDDYGLTKAHGEVSDDKHVTVRGSFIGFEGGLLAWFLKQPPDAVVDGYTNHVWTGGFVDDYAACLVDIALSPITGIVHLVGEQISKYALLHNLGELRPDITVRPVLAPDGPKHMALISLRPAVPTLANKEAMLDQITREAR